MTYEISDDPQRFDLERAHGWIAGESYWADGVPFETFARGCANSMVVGAYAPDGTMAAMARVITDRATFAWVCDVFVDAAHRGAGLGKQLMTYVRAHPDLQGFRRIGLTTRDAHTLYEQFGFRPLGAPDRFMEVWDPDVYRRG